MLRQYAGALVVAPLAWTKATLKTRQVAQLLGEQLSLSAGAWLFVQCDWAIAVLVNGALGAELLQRAGRELWPRALGSKAACKLWDSLCISFGLWGLARQLRSAAKQPGARRNWPHLLQKVSNADLSRWDLGGLCRRSLETLDSFLVL